MSHPGLPSGRQGRRAPLAVLAVLAVLPDGREGANVEAIAAEARRAGLPVDTGAAVYVADKRLSTILRRLRRESWAGATTVEGVAYWQRTPTGSEVLAQAGVTLRRGGAFVRGEEPAATPTATTSPRSGHAHPPGVAAPPSPEDPLAPGG